MTRDAENRKSQESGAPTAANIQRIAVLPGDGQAVYKVLLAARALEGVMFNHDEWDEAMSAFGRISLIASAKGASSDA